MFTTVTFEAQLLSMPKQGRDAAEAGAVADAGGHGDHRASDVSAHHAGQRPFHARHDDHRVGLFQQGRLAVRRCGPATPTSWINSTSAPVQRAVSRASSATGKSLVPAVTIATRPALRPLSSSCPLCPSWSCNPERPADGVVASGRELHQQFGGLLRRHAGRQHVGPVIAAGPRKFSPSRRRSCLRQRSLPESRSGGGDRGRPGRRPRRRCRHFGHVAKTHPTTTPRRREASPSLSNRGHSCFPVKRCPKKQANDIERPRTVANHVLSAGHDGPFSY